VILRHDDEVAEAYVLERDAVWSGIEILPVCRKKKSFAFSLRENKMAVPLNMSKENFFPTSVIFNQTTRLYIPIANI
jgi:hypothetical protein